MKSIKPTVFDKILDSANSFMRHVDFQLRLDVSLATIRSVNPVINSVRNEISK